MEKKTVKQYGRKSDGLYFKREQHMTVESRKNPSTRRRDDARKCFERTNLIGWFSLFRVFDDVYRPLLLLRMLILANVSEPL